MMAEYDNLWAELTLRETEILPGERLEDAWRALLLAYPDRFMVGSATYATTRWDQYASLIALQRRWLFHLPGGVARKIAHDNAVRLFGVQ